MQFHRISPSICVPRFRSLQFLYGDPLKSKSTFAVVFKPAGLPVLSFNRDEIEQMEQREEDSDVDHNVADSKGSAKPVGEEPPYKDENSVQQILHDEYGVPYSSLFHPHRLDKHTSGLVAVAFDKSTIQHLNRSLVKGEWRKSYHAVVDLPPCRMFDLHYGGIQRDRHYQFVDSTKMFDVPSHRFAIDGRLNSNMTRRSFTNMEGWDPSSNKFPFRRLPCGCPYPYQQYHPFAPTSLLYRSVDVEESIPSREKLKVEIADFNANRKEGEKRVRVPRLRDASSGFTLKHINTLTETALVKLELLTGRTHQLRVHMADQGLPIHNDPYYNTQYIAKWFEPFWDHRQQIASNGNQIPPSLSPSLPPFELFKYEMIARRLGKTFGDYPHWMTLQASMLSFPNPLYNGSDSRHPRRMKFILDVPNEWKRKHLNEWTNPNVWETDDVDEEDEEVVVGRDIEMEKNGNVHMRIRVKSNRYDVQG